MRQAKTIPAISPPPRPLPTGTTGSDGVVVLDVVEEVEVATTGFRVVVVVLARIVVVVTGEAEKKQPLRYGLSSILKSADSHDAVLQTS